MKDEPRIILNALLSQASRLMSMSVAFLMVPYLIGRLGEATYGVVGIAGSILAFMTLIEFGIRPATVRQYTSFLFGDQTRRANELVSTSMAFYVLLTLVIMLALGFFGRSFLDAMQVPGDIMQVAYWTLALAGLSLCVKLLTTPYRAALVAHLRHDVEYYTDMCMTFLRAGLIVAVFTLWFESLLVWGVAGLLSNLVAFIVLRRQSSRVSTTLEVKPRLVSRRGRQDLSTVGMDTTLAQLSAWLNVQSGPLIVSYFIGAAAVTHYAPVLVLMNALMSLSYSFTKQLIPVMTKAADQRNRGLMQRTFIRSARYGILMSGAAGAWVAAHADLVVPAWLGSGFEDTAMALMIWCGDIVLRTCTGAAFPIFLGSNRLRGVAIFDLLLAATSLGLAVYLAGYTDLGILGVAISALVAQAIRTTFRVVLATRICELGLFEFVRHAYLGTAPALLALVGVAWGIQRSLDLGLWPELILSGAGSLAVYAVAAWTIGLTAEDRVKALDYARRGLASFKQVLRRRL